MRRMKEVDYDCGIRMDTGRLREIFSVRIQEVEQLQQIIFGIRKRERFFSAAFHLPMWKSGDSNLLHVVGGEVMNFRRGILQIKMNRFIDEYIHLDDIASLLDHKDLVHHKNVNIFENIL